MDKGKWIPTHIKLNNPKKVISTVCKTVGRSVGRSGSENPAGLRETENLIEVEVLRRIVAVMAMSSPHGVLSIPMSRLYGLPQDFKLRVSFNRDKYHGARFRILVDAGNGGRAITENELPEGI